MSLQDVRVKLETGLNDIYTALEEKSATIPEQKNLINVAPAIRSITGGGGDNSGEYVWSKYSDYVKANENIKLLLPFDENIIDSTGNNTPTLIGNNTYGNGKYGKAKYFNNTTDYVEIPYTEDINIDTGDFTIAYWMKGPYKTENANSVVFSIGDVNYNVNPSIVFGIRMGIYPNRGLFASITKDSSGTGLAIASGEHIINENEWTHIALIRKGNTLSLYANGSLINSVEFQGRLYNRDTIRIGCRVRTTGEMESPYLGYIDDFVLAKEALYDGNFTPTKILYEDTGTFEEYIVSDDENAYPNNDFGEDGFYYIKGSVENTEATITMLEYIEATGTQYIDTGFVPNQDTSIEMNINITEVQDTKWLLGSNTQNGISEKFSLLIYNPSHSYIRFDYGSETINYNYGEDFIGKNTSVKLSKNILYFNDVEATRLAENTFNCTHPLFLLSVNFDGIASNNRYSCRLYSCKIWDNGTLVRDFVPTLLNSEACLYDKVTGYYFTNKGTGSFNAGPIVE